jgi:hypothetical protein
MPKIEPLMSRTGTILILTDQEHQELAWLLGIIYRREDVDTSARSAATKYLRLLDTTKEYEEIR